MLERLNKLVDPRPASSVALTAFRTAIRQQEDFKETAEDIRVRQEQAVASQKQNPVRRTLKRKIAEITPLIFWLMRIPLVVLLVSKRSREVLRSM